MNKTSSIFLFCAIFVILATTLFAYFYFREKLNGMPLLIGIYTFLAIEGISLIFSFINLIKHRKGICIKYDSKDLIINTDKQNVIFIEMPQDELYKIEPDCNITNLVQHTGNIYDCSTYVSQNHGFLSPETKYKLNNTTNVSILTCQEDFHDIRGTSGLCIVVKNNPQLAELTQPSSLSISYNSKKKNTALLSLFSPRLYGHNNPKYFYSALQDKAIPIESLGNSECTVYDHVVSNILSTLPTEHSDDNSWFETGYGKIAISFFTKFSIQDISTYKKPFEPAITEALQHKIKRVQEYISNMTQEQCTDEFNKHVFSIIKNIHTSTSLKTTQYSFLHYNRHVNIRERICDLIYSDIYEHPLYRCIHIIAVQNCENNDPDMATNQFIINIFNTANIHLDTQPITRFIKNPDTLITQDTNIENEDFRRAIYELLGNKQQVSFRELIKLARNYMINRYSEHMKFYTIDTSDIELDIDYVTILTPERAITHNNTINDIDSVEEHSSTTRLIHD
ncbi:hypothetical protein EDL79_01540 [Ehrlichia ruminantium]|uniref:Uncharacterized protein n=1 Tax=Ehrlichia ruminantium TaxID=779 RepID=A0AAE6Q8S2_EHRRU|nr:hypothetical protein [Ehrlichia ruminantium]QGR02360.1 hypothetical protein EDL81_01545 [Ehrlichia ruminantium]QGR03279.1 hypothetical protein EDL80_01540 [Ehrlichia ruminantium]QGR04204.1 hypothetical protein EDL79_01540 [Ehrlichia ruminantium]